MSRDIHHVVIVVVPNPQRGAGFVHGGRKFLAVAHFGATLGSGAAEPCRVEASGGTKQKAAARAVEELLRVASRRAPSTPAPREGDSAGEVQAPPRIAWQCSGCRWGFEGPWRKVCPSCGREDYWTGSVHPSAKLWATRTTDKE